MRNRNKIIIAAAILMTGCSAVEDTYVEPAQASVSTQVSFAEIITETSADSQSNTESSTVPVETDLSETESGYDAGDDSIDGIELSFYSVSLYSGESAMPIVKMFPEDAEDKSEIWTSSDETIATVDGLGNITAVSQGECIVTVYSKANPVVCADVVVTVKEDVTELTYIDGILVVNKSYGLPKDYNPGVNEEAQAAFDEMRAAAAEEGLNIYISSGFRSYEYQQGLYERYVQRSGQAEADRYSARPGHSEHQTGLAFDLNTIDESFADTEEYVWVKAHCAEYGFIIRYPENGEAITGYMYEPWHIRYLGGENAIKVTESGLTLEEYLGIDSRYE